MDGYDVIEIPSKHGVIHLYMPKCEASQAEIDAFYQTIAEVLLNSYKDKQKATKG